MTRMLSMSVRLGTGHQLAKTIEQIPSVVRARGGLRVVLHAARGDIDASQTFQRAVVEIPVRERDWSEVRFDDSGDGGRPCVARLRSPISLGANLLGPLRNRFFAAPTAREAVRRDREAVVVAGGLDHASGRVQGPVVRASVA